MFCNFNYLCFSSHFDSCICLALASVSICLILHFILYVFWGEENKKQRISELQLALAFTQTYKIHQGTAGRDSLKTRRKRAWDVIKGDTVLLAEHYSPNTQLPSLGKVTMNKEDSNNINTTIHNNSEPMKQLASESLNKGGLFQMKYARVFNLSQYTRKVCLITDPMECFSVNVSNICRLIAWLLGFFKGQWSF